MKLTHLVRTAAGAAFVLSASVASAQTAFFGQGPLAALTARNDLQSFLETTGNNNLNLVATGALPATISLGVFGMSIASGNGSITSSGDYCGTGRCIRGSGVGNSSYTFSFSQLINGFGADWFDAATFNPLFGSSYGLRYTLFNGTTQVGNAVFQDFGGMQPSGNMAFFGVFSNQTFNNLVVDVKSGDVVEIDNLTVGRASVPEPSTLALTAAGLAGLFAVARRRRDA